MEKYILSENASKELNQYLDLVRSRIIAEIGERKGTKEIDVDEILYEIRKQQVLEEEIILIKNKYTLKSIALSVVSCVAVLFALIIAFVDLFNTPATGRNSLEVWITILSTIVSIAAIVFTYFRSEHHFSINYAESSMLKYQYIALWTQVEKIARYQLVKESQNKQPVSIMIIMRYLSEITQKQAKDIDVRKLLVVRNEILHEGRNYEGKELEDYYKSLNRLYSLIKDVKSNE